MDQAQIEAVIARQMPDARKRRLGRHGGANRPVAASCAAHHPARDPRGADMTRSVLFDTETTGLDPMTGDRVIEIAAVELIGDLPTGKHFPHTCSSAARHPRRGCAHPRHHHRPRGAMRRGSKR